MWYVKSRILCTVVVNVTEATKFSLPNDVTYYRQPMLYLLIMFSLLVGNGYYGPLYYLPQVAVLDVGLSTHQSDMLILRAGFANVPFRIIICVCGQYSLPVRFLLYFWISLLGAVATCLMFVFPTYEYLVVYSFITGLVTGT